jgi:predicted enzyme related to lactoylglutathione lyase
MSHFFQTVLRTLDVPAAHAFYASVLGEVALQIVPLHELALARGAQPHWLGFLDVPDVERAAAEFTARGASALGPKWVNPAGLEAAVMRDPGGAVLALAKPPAAPSPAAPPGPEVVWHLLNTAEVGRAKAHYAELFGWEFRAPLDLGQFGVLHPFAFESGARLAGFLSDIAGRPGVHPHWLFHFRVPTLDAAVAAAQAGGGKVLGPFTLPDGTRLAVCDDPQGAAFALRE